MKKPLDPRREAMLPYATGEKPVIINANRKGDILETLKWADYIPQETLFWRRRIWDCSDWAFPSRFLPGAACCGNWRACPLWPRIL